ncbi:MAG: Asp-tRNA(Asn)/Glu-tRNA(Gln) amidotransferase subunit GatC [Planctomycetes bacterium]|jgi:aspartyl/glutamyl-tRNA(Asn/Gln) amidotransferase C subunit|nr:Asp-tRNA(Asn)/Glu-tRNA(Gln) amidotransferase subunit GatC [Planctomycetota bacterium]HON44354.1 Asp-tRNA(Asn)/Glu-tRNA(Gln) amidotransferase subunit GatC [Planctomycetota bacterium]HPY75307.1 Asp-tRNA(Asn)/Glu-tRNA(Gln) amidotransferase subunit GatC [Planctomycetota bacterium]HQB00917.1 Asp-tRNA(Asn)/Glu-tRNA(Gln) amidotransferase subunit GatC [Planctomycetota bacterium]HRU52085.1 Asp-tRNA(Asn)/Glu-tRNA(Gln) amidotransferase subunit GatC [Planctomycetota bacterium]
MNFSEIIQLSHISNSKEILQLARISNSKTINFEQDMTNILSHFSHIQDTLPCPCPIETPSMSIQELRVDEVEESMSLEDIQKNAKNFQDNFFVVPKIL